MTLSISDLNIFEKKGPLSFGPFNFEIKKGEILTVFGPSGSGKSTLLNTIAGHLEPSFSFSGELKLNQKVISHLEANLRKIGLIFQDHLLFPHLNVWEQLAFCMPQDIQKKERKSKAHKILNDLNLLPIAYNMPDEISGGQCARISVVRTLLSEPEAILLDEPFNNLDKLLRSEFRSFVFSKIRQSNIPALMVTHDETDRPEGGKYLKME